MKKKTVIYKGFISIKYVDGFDFICLEDNKQNQNFSLYHRLGEIRLYYKNFSIRYGISTNKFTSLDELQMRDIEKLEGTASLRCEKEEYRYSEWTSGVDYVTEMKFGGHDLHDELYKHNRDYCIIEITYW